MLLFSETSKCIFNYMSKKLYITLANLQIRICQLSAFFSLNFSSLFPHTKVYFLPSREHNRPCHWSGYTNVSMTYFLDKFHFFSQRWPLKTPKFFESPSVPAFVCYSWYWTNCWQQFPSEKQRVGRHGYAMQLMIFQKHTVAQFLFIQPHLFLLWPSFQQEAP